MPEIKHPIAEKAGYNQAIEEAKIAMADLLFHNTYPTLRQIVNKLEALKR